MAEATTLTPELEAKKKQILELTSHKHVKIWLLHEVCLLKNGEVAYLLNTNAGHCGNSIKDYLEHPEKIEAAKAFLK